MANFIFTISRDYTIYHDYDPLPPDLIEFAIIHLEFMYRSSRTTLGRHHALMAIAALNRHTGNSARPIRDDFPAWFWRRWRMPAP